MTGRIAAISRAGPYVRLGAWVVAVLLTAGFVMVFSARPAIVLSTASLDDALFIRIGRSLAGGRWLGHYDEKTLVKGIGFPAFLALANLAGLSFTLAIGLFHAACSSFAAVVVGRLTRSLAAGLAMLAALLLAPSFYDGEFLRASRDFFNLSLTVAFAAAALALVGGCFKPRRWIAVLTGGLGAWLWLTREEGVWLIPFALLLAATPLLVKQGDKWWRAVAPSGLALLVSVSLVVGVGLVNKAVYGRFVVNEIKDGAFQGAMTALQDASAPYHHTGIPVPAAARARIYAVSPAFASLKAPVLDGPLQGTETRWGCRENRAFCDDFGGGWFMWVMRTTAGQNGEHASAQKAAAFYRRLSREVRQACADGRLTCRHWPVPLVPPMKADEIGAVAQSFGKVADLSTFGRPVRPAAAPSDLTSPVSGAQLDFLGRPAVRTAPSGKPLDDLVAVDGAGSADSGEDLWPSPPSVKARIAAAWIRLAAGLGPLFRAILVVGAVAYGVLLIQAARRRRLSIAVVACTALLASVLARTLLLALVDALSFSAGPSYALPGTAFLLMFSVIAVQAALASFFKPRQEPA